MKATGRTGEVQTMPVGTRGRTALRNTVVAWCVLPLLALLAGCGGGADGNGQGGDSDRTITVGLVPAASAAAVQVAIDQGYFKDENLTVQIKVLKGPAITAALLNGEIEIGSLGSSVVVTAVAQGLPLKIIAGRDKTPNKEEDDTFPFMTMPSSGIKDVQSLSGQKVAVNSLGSINALFSRKAIDKLGGDSSKVQFIEMDFPDMISAMKSGAIGAASMLEPFASQARSAGAVTLFGAESTAFPDGAPVGVLAATSKYIDENPEITAAFRRALDRAVAWCAADEARFRRALPKLAGLSKEQAEATVLPTWSTAVSEAGLSQIADELKRQGMIDTVPGVSTMLDRGAAK